jgi:hypothetical protein
MPHIRIIGLTLAVVASSLTCATPNKYTPSDGSTEEPDGPDTIVPPGTARMDSGAPSTDAPVPPSDLSPGEDALLPPDGPCGSPTDPRNCGICGHDCTRLMNVVAASVTCQAGKCVVPAGACALGYAHCSATVEDGCETNLSVGNTCGGCGSRCGVGQICKTTGSTSACVSCGGPGQPCCAGTCNAGNSCANDVCTGTCVPGIACGTNNMCTKSLISCTTGSPVCISMAVNEGITCSAPTCSGTSKIVEGRCSGGQCIQQTTQMCLYGCSAGMCSTDCPSGFNKTATGCETCGAGTPEAPQPCCQKDNPCTGKRICCGAGLCGHGGTTQDICIACGVVLSPCCGPQKTDSNGRGPSIGTCDNGLVCTDQGVYQDPPIMSHSYLCDQTP